MAMGFRRGRYLLHQQQEHLWRPAGHSKDSTGTSEMQKVIIDLKHLCIIGRSTSPSTAPLFVITVSVLNKPVCFPTVGFLAKIPFFFPHKDGAAL